MKRPPLPSLALAAALLVACSADTRQTDTGLAQDLALASQVQAPPQLIPQDTAPAAPATPATAPRPAVRAPARLPENPTIRTVPPPAPQTQATVPDPVQLAGAPVVDVSAPAPTPLIREVGAGTAMTVASSARVCTNSNRPGDKIVASLTSPVFGTNGAVIPAGSTVVLEVASASAGDSPEAARITFRLRSVMVNDVAYPVTGDVTPIGSYERERIMEDPSGDKKKVIGGAIAGAIAGKIIGGNAKGAVIGAAAGAATGAAVAKSGQKHEACLGEGTEIRITLAERIVLG